MSNPQIPPVERSFETPAEKLLFAEIEKRRSEILSRLSEGRLPTEDEVEIIDRLSRIKAASSAASLARKRRRSFIVFAIGTLMLLASVFIRLPASAVELDVYATQMKFALAGKASELLIPGESGEVVALKRAYVSGAEDIDPPFIGAHDLKLNMAPLGTADFAIRLQELELPAGRDETLTVGIAYGPGLRGLDMAARGSEPAIARLGEVISPDGAPKKQFVIRPIRASGKCLRLEIFPLDPVTQFAVLRNVPISNLTFEAHGRSSLLRGSAIVKSSSEDRTLVKPGDRLDLLSDQPLLMRELTLSKGELHATVSCPHATAIRLGDDRPQNLMPTIFDWVRLRWPTQLYATLSALVALWLAIQRWWESLQ